jgi:hypothetical protein
MKTKTKHVTKKKQNLAKGKNSFDWKRKGETWKVLLNFIQAAVGSAKPKDAQIIRERWDAPELQMQWSSPDSIDRAIQILISTEQRRTNLVINGSAWKDSNGMRHWKTEPIKTIAIPRDLQMLLPLFQEHLNASVQKVSSWTEADLVKTDSLPCHSCN